VVQIGQEMDFKILRIDSENKKIGLSARAVGRDEPVLDTKIYSSEAGSGMASLGELADFALSKPEPKSEPESKLELEPKPELEPEEEPK
jgi:small subunit ribosomal protein S1